MTPEVTLAIKRIASRFAPLHVVNADDKHGGASIIVEGVSLGAPFH